MTIAKLKEVIDFNKMVPGIRIDLGEDVFAGHKGLPTTKDPSKKLRKLRTLSGEGATGLPWRGR